MALRYKLYLTAVLLLLLQLFAMAQQPQPAVKCATDPAMARWLQTPAAAALNRQIEERLLRYRLDNPGPQQPNAVVTLPVVVHIMHNNGTENISDAQAIQGIQFLNQAFANTGFYNPADGVDCQIQFCMARRDPAGNATNGITRDVTPLTNLNMDTDDITLKNINRWNPLCYINIWLVREICSSGGCDVAGYAYYPAAHGSVYDGIVMEAMWFGSTAGNTGILVHEMGHYLGLKHTFNGGCTNNNCLVDGDAVCDTPPDQSTAYVPCNGSANSCNTDALSGFTSDQNDLHRNYLDYGDQNCFSMFTQGQADRMNWHITNVRSTLLSCTSCLDPCPAPVTAAFTTPPGPTINAGSSFNFVNTSVNAASYEWYVNGVLLSTTTNFNYTFSATGTFTIKLIAKPGNPLCTQAEKTFTIQAVCPVQAAFTKSAASAPCGTLINFTNTSTGANAYEWYINGSLQATTSNFSYTSSTAGKYVVKLVARNTAIGCSTQVTDTVEFTCPVAVSISPQNPVSFINTTINFTGTAPGATSFQWLLNGIPAATTPGFSFIPSTAGNYVITLIASNGICSVTQSTFALIKDTCLRSIFQKKFGGSGNDVLADIQATGDGGYVAAGYSNGFGAGGYDAVVVKTDGNGTLQWNRVIGSSGNDYFNKVIATPDGGYLAAGYTSSFGAQNVEAWMVKLSSTGTVQWSRKYADGNANGSVIWDVCSTSDGGYAFAGVNRYTPGLADAMVGKTDAAGQLQWCRSFSGNSSDQSFGILEDNGVLVVTAFGVWLNSFNFYDGVFMKLDRSNGNVLSAKVYDIESRSNWFTGIKKQNNDYLIGCNNSNDYNNTAFAHIMLRVDNNGLVKQITRANSGTDKSGGAAFTPTADGGYLLAQSENNGTADIHLRKNTPAGNLQWLRKYGTGGSNDILYSIIQAPDNSYAGCGVSGPAGNNDFYLFKSDAAADSSSSCPPAPTDGTNATPAYTQADFVWPNTGAINVPQNNTVTPAVTSFSLTPTELCAGTVCVPASDTCFNAFQKTYGGTGDDVARSIKKLPGTNTGYIAGGYTSSYGAGGQDGYLLRLSSGGEVLWAKAYGGSGNDLFNHVWPTASGGFVAAGRTQSFGYSSGAAYIVNVDAAGNLIWSRAFGNNTFNGEYAYSVRQTSDGGFAVAASYNAGPGTADMLVMRLDASGNLLWSKTFDTGSTDEGQDILEDNDTLVVVGFFRGFNFHDGVLMKLNKNTGALIWSKAYDVNGSNDGFFGVEKSPGGYAVVSSSSIAFTITGVKQVSLRFDQNGNPVYSHELFSATNKPADRVCYSIDGGYIVTASEGTSNDDVFFYKVNAQKQLVWKRRFTRPGKQNVLHIVEDGRSIVMTGLSSSIAGGQQDILLIKTTATGTTPGCTTDSTDATINTPTTVPVNYNPTIRDMAFQQANPPNTIVTNTNPVITTPCTFGGCDSVRISGDNTVCLTADTITYRALRTSDCNAPIQWITDPAKVNVISAGDTLLKLVFLQPGPVKMYVNLTTGCKVVSDSIVVMVENCAPNTDSCGAYFTGRYLAGADYVSTDFRPAADRSIVAVGYRSNPVTGNDAMIIKTNSLGRTLWTRFIRGSGDDRFVKMRETMNGNFIAIGYTSSAGRSAKNILISRFSANGNLLWSKVIGTSNAADECTGADVLEMSNGQLVYIGKLNVTPGNVLMVGKLTAAGANIWIKHIRGINTGLQVVPAAGVLNGDTLFITGVLSISSQSLGLVTRFNAASGILVNTYGIQTPSGKPITVNGIDKVPGGFSVSLLEDGRLGLLKLSNSLGVLAQGVHTSPWLGGPYFYTAPTSDSGFISMAYSAQGDIALAKTNAGGQVEWARRTTGLKAAGLGRLQSIPGGYLWNATVISPYSGLRQAALVKMGTDTHLGLCGPDSSISTTLTNPGFTVPLAGVWTPLAPASTDSAYTDWYFGATGEPITDSMSCTQTITCDTLKLSGPAAVCGTADTITYKAYRNPQCTLPVQWQVNPAFGTIISSTDSTVRIKWLQQGNTRLYASLQAICILLKDSIDIRIANPAPPVHLGPDVQLCEISTVNLHAGPGYKRYTWQDGFADSVYTASLPGTYHVTVEDSCGNISSDTIHITLAPTIPFDLGGPLLRCSNDTLAITAPAGFTAYSWAANYNISSQQGQTIKVWPAVDTTYTVVAVVGNGCIVQDTVRVRVAAVPPLNLGSDTSFCQGGSLTLNAGPGFSTYLWSTGAATQTINAAAAGPYWVRATTADGCTATDTLRILNVFPNPVISLGNDTSICQGTALPLNAGPGFAGYLWSTGATTQSISISTPGLYWVQVTSSNNCSRRDSMQLLSIYPRPPIQLGSDTSLCQGGSLTLNAGPGFSTYLWSTGAATQTINAAAAGPYWVRATTADGCTATDTLRILNVFPNPAISLGNDTSICQGTALPLNAGPGFSSYLWNTGATTQSISAGSTGLYWVQATTVNNCSGRDTIRLLNVFPAPVVNIGNDTSFCQGGAALLDAGPGFSSYRWNTGATSQSISAANAGLYWVQVTNGFSCSRRDSMQVLTVHPLPQINLGRDTILCQGSSLTLSPGAGFSSYLWQNGTTGSSYSTSTAGTYWVQVTSNAGCIAADTMRILRISPIPQNFVTPSTGMCLYEPVLIKSIGTYSKYSWSTGATGSTVSITAPGSYWLQVTNRDGCTAREDFTVFDRKCVIAIYFPRAFTPTGDGRNELYRPGVYGPLELFTMEIYNRWGQLLYRTTNPAAGWDGTHKGVAQAHGAYVWMSTYKFRDKPAVSEKGSFLLIR